MHSAVRLVIAHFGLMAQVAATYHERNNSVHLIKPYIPT